MPLHTILYYSTFFVLFFLLVASIHLDRYGKKVPYFALIVLLVLFNGLRHYVGWDYHIYLDGYSNSYSEALIHMEPFWKSFRLLMLRLNLPVAIWFLVTALFIVVFTLRAYRQQSYFFPLALITYVLSFSLYFESFSTVRQLCAQAVVLFAFPLFREKKYWQTLLLLLIAFTLHRTAAMMILFLPLCFVRYPRWLVGSLLVLAVFLFPPLIHKIFALIAEQDNQDFFYLDKKFLLENVRSISFATLFRLAFAFYLLYRQKELLQRDANLLPFLNALYFASFFNLMFFRVFVIGTATRFSLYFTYTYPILISNVYCIGKSLDRWAILVMLLFESVLSVRCIYADDTKFDRYYQYETIFFDKEQPMTYPGKETSSLFLPLENFIAPVSSCTSS